MGLEEVVTIEVQDELAQIEFEAKTIEQETMDLQAETERLKTIKQKIESNIVSR